MNVRHFRFARDTALTIALTGALFAPAFAAELQPIAQPLAQPVAPLRPVTTTYFGTPVVDNYRYLENLGDPEVQGWMKAQSDYTRKTLDSLPGRDELLARIHTLANTDAAIGDVVRRGERYFYTAFEPGSQLRKLYYRDGLKGQPHLLLDPATMGGGSKTHYALDYFTPSWDGKLLAYGVSTGGSEASVLHVQDIASGKTLAEGIDRTSNSVISWRPDNRAFFYLRYNKPTPDMPASEKEYNARTYLHVIGVRADGDADSVVFGRGVKAALDVPEGQGTFVVTSPDSAYAVAVANHNMDSNPSTLYLAPLSGIAGGNTPWRKIADVDDGVKAFVLHGDTLYFLSQKGASRARLLSMPVAHPDLARATVMLPEGRAVLTDLANDKDGLFVRQSEGGVTHIVRISYDGKTSAALALPYEGDAYLQGTDPRQSGTLLSLQNWINATRIYSVGAPGSTLADTGLIAPSKVDTSQLVVTETFATSYDGTRVPLSIVHRKGLVLDGSHPALMQGYGSYGMSMESYFDPVMLAWVEHGGLFAMAHVRGGGEYGEDWHRGGQKLTKLNTVFDFIACGQFLVDQHYTSPKLLAGIGGSAGGITAGGALAWRPDLFGVILDLVGLSDTLRMEIEPNGPPNESEFGSTKTEDGFHGLYAMGAYYHIRDGVSYPAVMFSTGANDPRVSPWHMGKMAARVQAANASGKPVLLRVDYDAGHGIGSTASQYEVELADMMSFALWQMGDPAFQPQAH